MHKIFVFFFSLSLTYCSPENVQLEKLNCDELERKFELSDTLMVYGKVVSNLKKIKVPADIEAGIKNQLLTKYSSTFKNNIFGDPTRCFAYNGMIDILNKQEVRSRDSNLTAAERKEASKFYAEKVEELFKFLQQISSDTQIGPTRDTIYPKPRPHTSVIKVSPPPPKALRAQGYVLDEDGNGLDGVKISFKGATFLTNEDGFYDILFDPKFYQHGDWENAYFSKDGYKTDDHRVYISDIKNIPFTLTRVIK